MFNIVFVISLLWLLLCSDLV